MYGQLGYDDAVDQGINSGEISGLGDVYLGATPLSVSGGTYHTCATFDDGRMKCWGYGYNGALGYDSTSNAGDGGSSSTTMASLDFIQPQEQVLASSLGSAGYHGCAVIEVGQLKCWGSGGYGQLGQGSSGTAYLAGVGNGGVGATAMADLEFV